MHLVEKLIVDQQSSLQTNELLVSSYALNEEQLAYFSLEKYIIYWDNLEVTQVPVVSQVHILTDKLLEFTTKITIANMSF